MTFELSPSLVNGSTGGASDGDAYELKFHLPARTADQVEAWARQRLAPDPHGEAGLYLTTTLYCDTPRLDVYHRSPGFRRSKFRVRRYEQGEPIFLERKRRRGDRVRKRRDAVPLADVPLLGGSDISLDWPGLWFFRQVRFRDLRPACRIAYRRTAFQGASPLGPVRLTLDRDVIGVPAQQWDLSAVGPGRALLPGAVVMEMKFRTTLPPLFHELLGQLPPTLGRISKYRLCVEAWGLAGVTSR
jgi:hypothetical protein